MLETSRTLVGAKLDTAKTLDLPGRTWALLLGPDAGGVKNASMGYAIFPPGSAPQGHTHPAEEEIIYIVRGRGRLIAADCIVELAPGVAVYIPIGVEHSTEADAHEGLEMVTVFAPPVVPGSYESREP
jgi:quercetin dioxygenase-like cupin family protein